MTAQGYEFYLRVLVQVFPPIILPRVLRGCVRGNENACKMACAVHASKTRVTVGLSIFILFGVPKSEVF